MHRRWHVFALPSVHEGFPLAALEASASGLPIVASAVGGIAELVVHERTGYLVPRGDDAALAARLGALLQDDKLRVQMGNAARSHVNNQFTVDEMVRRTTAVYRSLLPR